MPITRHSRTGRWLYQFDRVIAGRRTRANKLLPAGWTRAQALDYDRAETARLFAVATGVSKPQPLIDDAVLLYLQQHAPKLKNHASLQGALALLHPHYTGRTLADLPAVARAYAASADAATLAPGTVRNRLAYLRAACRWAWRVHQLGEHDPAERMQLPAVRNARHLYLTRADMLRIGRAMGPGPTRRAMRLAFYTGMRAGEVLAARPITLASGQPALQIADSKNGRPRIVPLHPRVAHIVRGNAWPLRTTKWTVSKHVKSAMRAVGLGQARLHDLRHSAASEMINAGVDLYTVGGVLGHKSAASTQRYAHLATEKLAAAVATIGHNRAKKSQPPPTPAAA